MTGSSTKKQNPFVTGSSTKKKTFATGKLAKKNLPFARPWGEPRRAGGRAGESWGSGPKKKKNVCDGEFGQKNPSVRGPAKKKNVRAAKKKRITLSPYNDLLIISIK